MTKAFPNSVIFDAAPTLEALKKLPLETKSRLLLARLFKIGAHDTSALKKHNLMMVGDPYQLAYGYGPVENYAVRQHLLGAPWTRLVNEGYLADYGGQGFFTVTDEGREFLERDPSSAPGATAAASAPTVPARIPARTPGIPRALLAESVDLWNAATNRGVQPGQLQSVELPAARVHLTITLPRFSPAGQYLVAVTHDQNGNGIVAEGAAATAASGTQQRVTVDLDLRTTKSGAYFLSTTHEQDQAAYYYPLHIE